MSIPVEFTAGEVHASWEGVAPLRGEALPRAQFVHCVEHEPARSACPFTRGREALATNGCQALSRSSARATATRHAP
jgi:hypothetical protein